MFLEWISGGTSLAVQLCLTPFVCRYTHNNRSGVSVPITSSKRSDLILVDCWNWCCFFSALFPYQPVGGYLKLISLMRMVSVVSDGDSFFRCFP
ncbi:hypothetical protein DPMN_155030 [Dreissena polymorpha]|uniref:Uncharacterized protein n=1 Tax=Dreissena polymorpha TaxID=45954 RepID=A0A9D4J6A5_DREPO|nr:hypothetical protein DPMN_155030 [Dreissena polymorpha]